MSAYMLVFVALLIPAYNAFTCTQYSNDFENCAGTNRIDDFSAAVLIQCGRCSDPPYDGVTAESGIAGKPVTASLDAQLAPATLDTSTLPRCDGSSRPLEFTPGSKAVCRQDTLACPDNYLCETNAAGNGACCPADDASWNSATGACKKVTFSSTPGGSVPSAGNSKVVDTSSVATIQECALKCYKNPACVLATAAP